MTDRELEAALRKATRGSTVGVGVVGAGTLTMGTGAFGCGVLRLDPEMAGYSTGMWVAYGLMVLLFVGGGFAMVAAAVFILPNQGWEFVDRVLRRPETITRLYLVVTKTRGMHNPRPGQLGTSTSLAAESNDGHRYQFVVKGADAEVLLAAIAARAPQANHGPAG